MEIQQSSKRVNLRAHKSLAIAIIFSLFLGPIGLLYAGFWSGVIVTILMLIAVFIPKIGYVLFMSLWLVCPYWSVFVCTKHNARNYE